MKRNKVIAYTVVAAALVVSGAMASVPQLINYQGILTDDGGVPITGSHDLTFAIYADSAQGATVLWSESHTGVEVDAGLFNVILGGIVAIPADLFGGGDRWMGIAIDGGTEMRPRMQLTSVPWAFRAAVADSALSGGGGGSGGLTLPYADSVSVAYSAFAVKNEDATAAAIRGENKPNGNAGYLGHDQYGVYGTSATEGVRGQNSSGHYGLLGGIDSGAFGQNAAGHYGLLGGSTYGVYGRNTNGSRGYIGHPVYGVAGYSDTVGVHGGNTDTGHYGRLGMTGYAVFGRNSNGNVGYFGSDNYGAVGQHGNGNYGFLGGTLYGVYGTAPGGGYAAYFAGNAFVEDTLDVTGTTRTDYLEIDGGADLAEPFDITGPDVLEPGSVVVIDAAETGALKISTGSYDTRVAGVISGAGGIHTGLTLNQSGLVDNGQNVALSGRVYVRATASNGPIRPGDLLTTSSLAGHAMRATDSKRTHGAVLGKAMSSLESGEGLVLVLVSLQ